MCMFCLPSLLQCYSFSQSSSLVLQLSTLVTRYSLQSYIVLVPLYFGRQQQAPHLPALLLQLHVHQ